MTLNQYIKLFTDISTAHKQVKYFGNGAIHEYLDTNVNTELGAHLWLEIDKSNITKGVLVDSFTLYCMDYVNKDITNRNDVLSDTKRILEDVIALLYNPVYADLFELDENNQLDVFYDEQNAGEACGWKTNISLKQDFLYDSCQIPLDGIPVGEGGYVVPTSWSPDISWGDILGTLSNQTDLQTALDLKANKATTLTINGTTYDLSANRSWTISGGGETLAQTLALGNQTGFNNIIVNDDQYLTLGTTAAGGIRYNSIAQSVDINNNNGGQSLSLTDTGNFVFSNATPSRVWISDSSGNFVCSTTTDTQLSYLDATSSIQTQINSKQASLGYTAENSANKTDTVSGNTTSSTKYLSVKGYYDYLIQGITQALSSKTTPVDADSVLIEDYADSNKTKKLSWANIKATLKTYFDTLYIPLTGLASPTSTSIGYIPNVYYMRQNSGYTLNSTTGVQKLFNGTANGRVTLPVGIYHITAQIYLTSMDTGTSGNASFSLVSGSGTATNFIMDCYGADASPITGTGNRTGSGATTNAFPSPNMLTATTAARMIVTVNGSFEVTGAGTFIPSIALTSAASAVSDIGTMIKIECVGVTGTPYAGAWD